MTRRAVAFLVALTALLATAAGPATIAIAAERASFTDIQGDVMCVVCHEPLALAQSPEAFQERDYIRQLIVQGRTKREILADLVEQYGPAVLAKPPAHGFNLSVYIVPPLALVVGLVTLAVFIPRWRRRAREAAANAPDTDDTARALSDEDSRRLDEDLARTL
jgi:cytochrome c-type biogenesis protein CcmH/NrfF